LSCGGNLVKNGSRILHRQSIRRETVEKVQRWFCPACKASFSKRKQINSGVRTHFTKIFVDEVVRDFIQGRSPCGVIKERKNISRGTVSSWVNQYGGRCYTPKQVSVALRFRTHNRWGGILLLDGKYLNRNLVLLLAVDCLTLDIVSWLVAQRETVAGYIRLVDSVEACGYVIGALISDGHPAIASLTREPKLILIRKYTRTYPRPGVAPAQPAQRPRLDGVPHQLCLVHAERDLASLVSKLPKKSRKILLSLSHQVLYAKNLKQALKRRRKLATVSALLPPAYHDCSLWISDHWEALTAHHLTRVGGKRVPGTSNEGENIISYLNARLKTIKRLRNLKSAANITNLIIMNYRFKPLENSKNKLKRNKTPLELVIGKKLTSTWTDFINKSTA